MPTILRGTTCTWTGNAGDNNWNNAGNWDCGTVPYTTSDEAIFSTYASVVTPSSIIVNTLTINEGLTLLGSTGLTFTANTISYNTTSPDFVSSAIINYAKVIVTTITLDAPNPYLISLELNNATLNGAVNTNAQRLLMTGTAKLNPGCSFSGGIQEGNGVEFSNLVVTVNTNVPISCLVRFIKGLYSGTGSFTLGNGRHHFGVALFPVTINVPVTINNTLSNPSSFNCANVVFGNTVTLNTTLGSVYFASVGNNTQPLEFKGAISSNKSFSVQGNPGSVVKFTNATVDIDGTTSSLLVPCDAVITNSIFNDDVTFLGNTEFFSGTFNKRLDIGSLSSPSKIFTIKDVSGAKSILGYTVVAGTLNWESGVITKNNSTSISISAGATLNISAADGFAGTGGQLSNYGTINVNRVVNTNIQFTLRTNNLGTINVNTGILILRSFELLSGTLNIANSGTCYLGGDNVYHSISSTTNITGTGTLWFSLGYIDINHALNTGNLNVGMCCGTYLAGSGSVTVPAGKTMRFFQGWTTIPLIINGTLDFEIYQNAFSNTITVNGVLNWNQGQPIFNANGKIYISPTGVFNIYKVNGTTTTNNDPTNTAEVKICGVLNNQANATFSAPIVTCNNSIVKGTGTQVYPTDFNIKGYCRPGNSPGTLTINPSVSTDPTTVFEMEIIGNQADQLASIGNIVLGGKLRLILGSPTAGSYTIFNSTGGTVSNYNTMTVEYSTDGGLTYTAGLPAYVNITPNTNNVVVTISTPLPIDLLTFQAQNTEGPNKLTWQTASEKNTSHFDIEKSKDGLAFEKIGEVKAAGNSQTPQYYSYLDKNPYDLSYYRLKIHDLDGKTDYSKTVSVRRDGKLNVKIYPNPAQQVMTVDMGEMENATLTVIDVLGKTVYQKAAVSGQNNLDVSTFSKGVYIIEIKAKGITHREKIVKN
jgi:Secretion system C-terminal sorting domain